MVHFGHRSGAGNRPDGPGEFSRRAAATWDPRVRAFYAQGRVDGNMPLSSAPLVALDLETTGLNPERDSIVRFDLVPMSVQRIQWSGAFTTCCGRDTNRNCTDTPVGQLWL